MTARTHIRIGTTATAATFLLTEMNITNFPVPMESKAFLVAILGSAIGSIIMDNDAKGTLISNFMPISNKIITWLAKKNFVAFYHRHLLHSLLCLPLLTILGCVFLKDSPLWSSFFFGCTIGLIGHALADAFLSNTWILYPICRKPFSVLKMTQADNPKKYKKVEKWTRAFFTLVFVGLIGFYVYSGYFNL